MSRILGIDYGRKRMGLAVSDEEEILASPLPTHLRGRLEDDIRALSRLVANLGASEIVVGLPRNMDGSSGPMAREVLAFINTLRRGVGLPVRPSDERQTSAEASRILGEAGLPLKRKKAIQDGLAAVLILQAYLDQRRHAPPDAS